MSDIPESGFSPSLNWSQQRAPHADIYYTAASWIYTGEADAAAERLRPISAAQHQGSDRFFILLTGSEKVLILSNQSRPQNLNDHGGESQQSL